MGKVALFGSLECPPLPIDRTVHLQYSYSVLSPVGKPTVSLWCIFLHPPCRNPNSITKMDIWIVPLAVNIQCTVHAAQLLIFGVSVCHRRRRIKSEEKAKVVASVWGEDFIPFLAALVVIHWMI